MRYALYSFINVILVVIAWAMISWGSREKEVLSMIIGTVIILSGKIMVVK